MKYQSDIPHFYQIDQTDYCKRNSGIASAASIVMIPFILYFFTFIPGADALSIFGLLLSLFSFIIAVFPFYKFVRFPV